MGMMSLVPSLSTILLLSHTFVLLRPISADAGDSNYAEHLINCGATGELRDVYNRTWKGDVGSSYLPGGGSQNAVASNDEESLLQLPEVPYKTARYSRDRLSYLLPVSPGRKFIRLHFYQLQNIPSLPHLGYTAVGASGERTFFEDTGYLRQGVVESGLGRDHSIREFSIKISQQYSSLRLTFLPYPPDTYAFVNGIEILSIPEDAFTSALPLYDGTQSPYPIGEDVALKIVHRLNIGGGDLLPNQDSGFFREWLNDSRYLKDASNSVGSSIPKDPNVTIDYAASNTPTYVAPTDVYATARSMRRNMTIALYNDPPLGFTYLVRLHFCEIRYHVKRGNDSVFDIFINNKLALEIHFDGTGIPVYRDFLVKNTKDAPFSGISVALTRSPESNTEDYDPFLNGVEIFRLMGLDDTSPEKEPSARRILIIVGVVVGVVLVLFCWLLLLRKKHCSRRRNQQGVAAAAPAADLISSVGASNPCRRFTYAQMEAATNKFDESRVVGRGGFGNVYWGTVDDGDGKVAIKRGNPMSAQGLHEFQTEIEMLSKLRHHHLVSLLGYCQEKGEMMLVYDHMANGTLRQHLYGAQKGPPLPWKQRLKICVGAARGLHYLHTGSGQKIIHRDVKTANILLDDAWVAKVSDFGLSKMGPILDDHRHVSTAVKGSFGYMDPEYIRRRQLSEKSDVYSFGVVLFEVLCSRPAVDSLLPEEQVSLVSWSLNRLKNGKLEEIIDPSLEEAIDAPCFDTFVKTAEKCLADRWAERPTMADVLCNLERALESLEGAGGWSVVDLEGAVGVNGSIAEKVNLDAPTPSGQRYVFSMIRNLDSS